MLGGATLARSLQAASGCPVGSRAMTGDKGSHCLVSLVTNVSLPVSMDTVREVFSLNLSPLHSQYPMVKAAKCRMPTGSARFMPWALQPGKQHAEQLCCCKLTQAACYSQQCGATTVTGRFCWLAALQPLSEEVPGRCQQRCSAGCAGSTGPVNAGSMTNMPSTVPSQHGRAGCRRPVTVLKSLLY